MTIDTRKTTAIEDLDLAIRNLTKARNAIKNDLVSAPSYSTDIHDIWSSTHQLNNAVREELFDGAKA